MLAPADTLAGRPLGPRDQHVRVALSVLLVLTLWTGGRDARLAARDPPDSPSRRTYRVLIDLSKKDMYVSIPGAAATTRLVQLKAVQLPSRYRLIPAEGVVRYGQDVEIVLEEFAQVRIRVSLVTRGKALAARISPMIRVGHGEPIEFTHDRMKRTIWSFERRVKDLQQQLGAARQEYQRIEHWLATPGNKPLDLHKTVRLRQKMLGQQIVACHRALPVAEQRFAAMRAITDLAEQIDATTAIEFSVVRY